MYVILSICVLDLSRYHIHSDFQMTKFKYLVSKYSKKYFRNTYQVKYSNTVIFKPDVHLVSWNFFCPQSQCVCVSCHEKFCPRIKIFSEMTSEMTENFVLRWKFLSGYNYRLCIHVCVYNSTVNVEIIDNKLIISVLGQWLRISIVHI